MSHSSGSNVILFSGLITVLLIFGVMGCPRVPELPDEYREPKREGALKKDSVEPRFELVRKEVSSFDLRSENQNENQNENQSENQSENQNEKRRERTPEPFDGGVKERIIEQKRDVLADRGREFVGDGGDEPFVPEKVRETVPEQIREPGPPPDICAGKRPCVTTIAGSPYDLRGPLLLPWIDMPEAMAYDARSNFLYISDSNKSYIYQIDIQKPEFRIIIGRGPRSFGYLDGPALQTKIKEPCGMAVDKKGDLYFSEPLHFVIRKYDRAAKTVSTVAGSGKSGLKDGPGKQAMFESPCGLVFDASDNLYIADKASIRRWNRVTGLIESIAGTGTLGFKSGPAKQAMFYYPRSIAMDSKKNLYISEFSNETIRKLDTNGFVTIIHGKSPSSFRKGAVMGLTFDAKDNLYFSDRWAKQIWKKTSQGAAVLLSGSTDYGYVDGPKEKAKFSYVLGLVFGNQGELYIADSGNHRIRRLDPVGQVSTFAGADSITGHVNGPAAKARFNEPYKVAIDSKGRIYVSEQKHKGIRRIDLNGNVSTFLKEQLAWGMVFDKKDQLFIARGNKIFKADLTGKVSLITGNTAPGWKDGPPGVASFSFATDIALSSLGFLFVTDHHLIRKVSPKGVVRSIDVSRVTGSVLSMLEGAAFDSKGNLYIVDEWHRIILKMDSNEKVSLFAGKIFSKKEADGPRLQAQFYGPPRDILIDKQDNIYISNSISIRKIDKNGMVTTIVGGTHSYGYRNGLGKDALAEGYSGMVFDKQGNIIVADQFNHRIRKIWLK